jgi:hypothetical protein
LLKVLGRYLLTYRKAEATEKVLETLNSLALAVDLGSATLRSMVQLAKADIWKDDREEALRWAYLKVALASFALGFSLLTVLFHAVRGMDWPEEGALDEVDSDLE